MKNKPQMRILFGGWGGIARCLDFGNPAPGGDTNMAALLHKIQVMNLELQDEVGIQISVSAHLKNELKIDPEDKYVGHAAKHNGTASISLKEWMDGVDAGYFPRIGRVVPLGFSWPWSHYGAMIHPDPEIQEFHAQLLAYAFSVEKTILDRGAGLGKIIVWDGPDSIRLERVQKGEDIMLGYEHNPELEEWILLRNGIVKGVNLAKERGCDVEGKTLIESKPPGNPGYLGILLDTKLGIMFVREVNKWLGFKTAKPQQESCHVRGAGQTHADALKQEIKEGEFGGESHLNAGPLNTQNYSELLARGAHMSEFDPYPDMDLMMGQGFGEWVDDQRNTIQVGLEWSVENDQPFEAEIDAIPIRHKNHILAIKESVLWMVDAAREIAPEVVFLS